ncbi:hypothetical protein BESB_083650 [Besnoitia besnoiti]|uniref:Uncharacterized protein n=1 Tax=Besnoitia besnoiti TaxID=94643 RepID=A0A2A9MB57_BESBE|nr:hypothetical protein BESB_083650 [Besnoitia besnoiti]PFH33166.1 hypothetical protein BESB_083650 [Besnoitia besnoiti]
MGNVATNAHGAEGTPQHASHDCPSGCSGDQWHRSSFQPSSHGSDDTPQSSFSLPLTPAVVIQTCAAVRQAAECGHCLDATEEKVEAAPRNVVLDENFCPLAVDAGRPNKFLFITNTYYDRRWRHPTALHDCANTVGALQRLLAASPSPRSEGDERGGTDSSQDKATEGALRRDVTLENSSVCFAINRSKAQFQQEFGDFCRWIQPGDSVCVYYSGHATEVSVQPCLVTPARHGARSPPEKNRHHIKHGTVNVVDMVDMVAARSPRQVCFILDCAASFDMSHRCALPVAVGLPMIYEFVGDKTIIMQSLSPSVSLAADLLSHRTLTAEDCVKARARSKPQGREGERCTSGEDTASSSVTTADGHDLTRDRRASQWDSGDSGDCVSRQSAKGKGPEGGEPYDRSLSQDSHDTLPLAHIEVACEERPPTPYESFLTHAKRACTAEELASLPETWERCVQPCSNLSFCISMASRSLDGDIGLDFLRIAQVVASTMSRLTNNTQSFCCLTNM